MSETKLTAADYQLRGLSPGQAAFAAAMSLQGPPPAPPAPTGPQQQLAAMQQQLNALYAKDDELAQGQEQSRRIYRCAPHLTTERQKLAGTIKAHRAAMDAIRK